MDFLQELKAATHDIHKEIEPSSRFTYVFSQSMTLTQYMELLQIPHDFIAPYGKQIQTSHPLLLAGREKISLLEANLFELGCMQPPNKLPRKTIHTLHNRSDDNRV